MKAVCLERDAEGSREQGEVFEVSKFSSQDQMFHDIFVPQMIEQLMNVPKIVLQDRVQRRNAERIADFPALPDMWKNKSVEAVKIVLQEHNPE